MKHRRALNGIAAVLMVGVFYAFAFSMAQNVTNVTEDTISQDYRYDYSDGEAVETEITEETQTERRNDSVENSQNAKTRSESRVNAHFINVVEPDESESENDLLKKHIDDIPVIVVPVESDEISDENYFENSNMDFLIYTDDDIEKYFPEEEDVEEYDEAEADKEASLTFDDEEESIVKFGSGDVTAESINNGEYKTDADTSEDNEVGETAEEEVFDDGIVREYPDEAEPEEPSSSYNLSDIVNFSGEQVASSAEIDGGEILTAKVHGEVQDFDAYELICMIVANEVSPSFSRECLKAQAVAAYSYVRYHMDRGIVATVLVKEDVPEEISSAVAEVWGVCCYYNGSVAQTVYTASTSGYQASAEHVWGGNSVPYLISQEIPFDVTSDPNYGLQTSFTEEEMRSKLENKLGITLSDDPSSWLTVSEYEDGNYVKYITIDGQVKISGRDMRERVLGFGIKSVAFTVAYNDGAFVFTTYGYGHGVGMSQNGANSLGWQGYSYIDILKFYFPGITVQ